MWWRDSRAEHGRVVMERAMAEARLEELERTSAARTDQLNIALERQERLVRAIFSATVSLGINGRHADPDVFAKRDIGAICDLIIERAEGFRRDYDALFSAVDFWEVEATDAHGVPIGKRRMTTHPPKQCEDTPCPIHHPTDHHMRSWPALWRADTGVLERRCEHGVGHPDPDEFAYWDSIGETSRFVHGCDGCCIEQGR